MKVIALALLSISLVIMSSCFQVETCIKLNKNGSGIIEETVLFKKDVAAQMGALTSQIVTGMGETMTERGDANLEFQGTFDSLDFFNEEELKTKAADWGEAVVYVYGKPIDDATYQGYKAIYAFGDVNTIQLNQKTTMPSEFGNVSTTENENFSTFFFTQGPPLTLTILQPQLTENKKSEWELAENGGFAVQNTANDQGTKGFMKMFSDIKITVQVKVPGTIIETNATHVKGNRLTLMEVDFSKLIDLPPALHNINPMNLTDAADILKNIPGMKVDMNEEIVVKFR